ncbi:MAG: type II toxin-antitoxin system RelE/ParE family toxin [Erysipelotrichaceae bacterium]
MDKYQVIISLRAYQNIDDIYECIAKKLFTTQTATQLIDKLEEAILSLETMPQRFLKRRVGAYANRGYRQLFVKNFNVIYRIDETAKKVFIITVRYSKSNF